MSWLSSLPGRMVAAFAVGFIWIYAGMGMRIWIGGKAYLTRLFGNEALAQRAFDRLSGPDAPTVLLGETSVGAGGLLALASLALALVLVLGVLLPGYVGLKLAKREQPQAQVLVYFALSSVATAALLLSVHPILNLKAVPEGPRTFLNYAFEAAGYGWTNTLAYVGAWGCAALFWRLGVGRESNAAAPVQSGPQAGSPQVPDSNDGTSDTTSAAPAELS